MGKSGNRKKKAATTAAAGANGAVPTPAVTTPSPPTEAIPIPKPQSNGAVDLNSSVFLKRANELKEEGNKRFQSKDYAGALEQYDNALRLTPKNHAERAVFHSNRAACLMQMKPVDYELVISECSLALQVQPRFGRALVRRAKAYEALAKYEAAMQDVQALLGIDPNHRDAVEIAGRLRVALGPKQEAQQDLQSRPSPAALGASAVRGAPISGLGPVLPARPVQKKVPSSTPKETVTSPTNKTSEKTLQYRVPDDGSEVKAQQGKSIAKPLKDDSSLVTPVSVSNKSNLKEQSLSSSLNNSGQTSKWAAIRFRSLKLVYDHDIRLAQMPVNCSFRILREIVTKRFPSSKSVLIKYKDNDGDLVTITCTEELRLAESCVDSLVPKEPGKEKIESFGMLRLHVVEVSPEQEPVLIEEEEEKPVEDEGVKTDESGSRSSPKSSISETVEIERTEEEATKEKVGAGDDNESKEVEMDDWLFEFAQLFRTHVGIDPDAHIDLHELGMELCSEALEETVTSEDAQSLFDMAASKFQEVAALAFFNWGNVHMCAARKRIPLDDTASKEVMTAQLQVAYDWVKEKYALAGEKYEEALKIKPDFYEGLLALGQQHFETAKLQWSFTLANKVDLSTWDPTDTIKLFDDAEEKMKAATAMWEKLEEQRINELKDPSASKKDDLLKRRKKQGADADGGTSGAGQAVSPEEAAEQAAVMRSQIHLFWGNMLFERSQVEFKLGLDGWNKNLDAAVERFKLAGASEADISVVLKNHSSNGDVVTGEDKKVIGLGVSAEANGKDEGDHAADR
ncbi:Protein clmp1 [Ranunculus cassubicifolius]